MSYFVVKKIKNRLYLYEQATYRENGRVKTWNRYVGPYSGSALSALTSGAPTPGYHYTAETQRGSAQGDPQTGSSKTTEKPPLAMSIPSKSPSLHPSQIGVKINLQAHNIASHTLTKKQDEWNAKLVSLGVHVAPGKAPGLKIKYGSKVTTTRSLMTGTYTITIPKPKKGKTHRTAFYQEYSRALARISLDCIAQSKPDLYVKLAHHFEKSFRKTNQALITYLSHTKSKDVWVKAVCLKIFGTLYKAQEALPDPERTGLVDYTKRPDWKSELTAIFASIQTSGINGVREEHETHRKRATRAVKSAITRHNKNKMLFTRKWFRSRETFRRALACERAMNEFSHKLSLVQNLFSPHSSTTPI